MKRFLSKLLKSKRSPRSQSEPIRQFTSYSECPELYYRINKGPQNGPKKLHVLVTYEANGPKDVIEFRFDDEDTWRPKSYMIKLWETIPASEYSRKRLRNEGITHDPFTTEVSARKLLREAQKNKPITPKQKKRLAEYGVDFDSVKNREQAKSIIKEKEKIDNERASKEALIEQREIDRPEIDKCALEIDKFVSSINEFACDWKPRLPKDLDEVIEYRELLEEALEYAESFDLESLQQGPFGDPKTGSDYYLEFSTDPKDEELNNLKKHIFLKYLKEESDDFNHVSILKKAIPSLGVSKL